MIADDEWIRTAFYQQKNALNELKKLNLKLYEEVRSIIMSLKSTSSSKFSNSFSFKPFSLQIFDR